MQGAKSWPQGALLVGAGGGTHPFQVDLEHPPQPVSHCAIGCPQVRGQGPSSTVPCGKGASVNCTAQPFPPAKEGKTSKKEAEPGVEEGEGAGSCSLPTCHPAVRSYSLT